MNCPRQTRSSVGQPRFVAPAMGTRLARASRPVSVAHSPWMDPAESVTDRPAPRFDEAGDATRRTWLANERTWLAWVRTGLTCTAVALGVGKVVPDLAKAGHRWPYTVLGVGYAVLGALLVLYGFQRRGEVDAAIRAGRYASPNPGAVAAFAALATLLGAGSVVLLIFS